MKLTEALKVLNERRQQTETVTVYLACGFNPQSLSSFVAAHLSLRIDKVRVQVKTGSFGDLPGNIEKARNSDADLIAVCIEWDDFDPRLGVRRLTQVTWKDAPEILKSVRSAKDQLLESISNLVLDGRTIALSLPHLAIPQLSHVHSKGVGQFEAELNLIAAEMQAALVSKKHLRLVKQLDARSMDLSSALNIGFPYNTDQASQLGESLAEALTARKPKKGIVVDLDDTLWKGILGEEGSDGVYWDIDHKAQHHGLFQQFLGRLAAEGTLVAVASKNSAELVEHVFATRTDLLLRSEQVFPIEAHWSPKSESISRILKAWNIAADSLVFVDDSALELAEVEAAHPGILCRSFPSHNPNLVADLLAELRDLFAKDQIGEEDSLRAESLRRNASDEIPLSGKGDAESLLASLDAEISLELSADASDERALALVNKTNQFNLNGERFEAPLWRRSLLAPNAFLLTVSYRDKFGLLGKIAVVKGTCDSRRMIIDTWVMSCRAFARRIEHACVNQLFQHFGVDEILFRYQRTTRNGPMAEFLAAYDLGDAIEEDPSLSKGMFYGRLPTLYHRVTMNSQLPEVQHV